MVNKHPKRIQSVQRAIALVEAIAASDDGMRLQDLARSIGVTAGAAHHLVDTLAASGWVARSAEPVRYRLGPALAELNGRHQQRRLMTAIEAGMRDLHRRLAVCSISLCEAVGSELVLSRAIAHDAGSAVIETRGTVLPAYTSAASLIHLAFWDAERAGTYRAQHSFTEHGAAMWGTPERFDAALRTVRRGGFAELPVRQSEALRLGVPIFAPGGGLAASFTITVHEGEVDAALRQRCIDESLAAAHRIRASLTGATP